MPLFPVVPNVPGVPTVARSPGVSIQAAPILLVADAVGVASLFLGPQWGVFQDAGTTPNPFGLGRVQVVGQDINGILNIVSGLGTGNFLDLDFKASFSIAEYPVENGGFQSYNKIQHPYDVAITVTAGGTVLNRQKLKLQVEAIMGTTNLYTVLMPEGPIDSLNVIGYGFSRRADRGLGLLIISILFKQVRPGGNPNYSTIGTPASTASAAAQTSSLPVISNPTTQFASATSQVSAGQGSPTQVPSSITSAIV